MHWVVELTLGPKYVKGRFTMLTVIIAAPPMDGLAMVVASADNPKRTLAR